MRQEAESQIHNDNKSRRLRQFNGKSIDPLSTKRRHKFTLHDVQSGGYGEYVPVVGPQDFPVID